MLGQKYQAVISCFDARVGKIVKGGENGTENALWTNGLGLAVEMSQVMVWVEVGKG